MKKQLIITENEENVEIERFVEEKGKAVKKKLKDFSIVELKELNDSFHRAMMKVFSERKRKK